MSGQQLQKDAVILTDTGSVGIYPPSAEILAAINKQIGTVASDCSNRDKLPPLTMTIDGVDFTIPSTVYVLQQRSGMKYKCSSAFMAQPEPLRSQASADAFWLMGDPFFRATSHTL